MKNGLRMIMSLGLFAVFAFAASGVKAQPMTVDDSRKLDEFQGAGWESAMTHLDAFAISLNTDPNKLGVIMVYGGNHTMRGEPRAWSACVKDYLANRRGIPAGRLIVVDGGYRDLLTVELWAIADRRHVPPPSQQIPRKDVRFKKGKMRPWRTMCNI